MKDYYRLLEVTPNASPEVVKAAFRALALLHVEMNDSLKLYNEAWEVLGDKDKRKAYDESLKKEVKSIGQYEIISKIAEGGFGKTYKGRHSLLGTNVCIKHASNISPEDEEIMKEEAKIMWDLRHWAIPCLREIIKLPDDSLAIVMSFVPGPTLEQLVQKGRMDYEHVCWIVERVLNALLYLHDNGVVHGDIKPQNIIVQPDTHQVVLVDYGLSVLRPKKDEANKGYTPKFASPEQERGMPLLPESDFYSLGMTMIYAFGGDISAKMIPNDLPKEIKDFIKSLIIRDPMSRPRWEKENLCKTISDIRQSVFGRRYSGMKPLK